MVRSDITCIEIPEITALSNLVVGVRCRIPSIRSEVILLCVYRQHNAGSAGWASIVAAIDKAHSFGLPLIACGDFNAHHSLWSGAGVRASDAGIKLYDLCTRLDLSVLNSDMSRGLPGNPIDRSER